MTDGPAADAEAIARTNLDNAVAAYVAVTGSLCTDWVMIAAGVNISDTSTTDYFVMDSGAAAHVRMGLIAMLRLYEEMPVLPTDDD